MTDSGKDGADNCEVSTQQQRDPAHEDPAHDPANEQQTKENGAISAPSTPSKPDSSNQAEHAPQSVTSAASPGNQQQGAANSPGANAASIGQQQQTPPRPATTNGQPSPNFYPASPYYPHPPVYYVHYPPPHGPPPPQPPAAPTGPPPPGPASSSQNAGQQQQPQQMASPTSYYPHYYYPPPPPPHYQPSQGQVPYAAQDFSSKGRALGGDQQKQQQQQQQPPPAQQPPAPPPGAPPGPPPYAMHPPPMYAGWAPVPVAHPMPGHYVPVGPPPPRYPGSWGPPPPQPQRAFNHKKNSLMLRTGSSPSRKKFLGKGPSNKSRKLTNEEREAPRSPTQIAAALRDEIENTGCTCKKTRCLKLYCQCFGVKIYCGPHCRCFHCANTREKEKERQEAMRNILSRNPLAFDTKFTDPRGAGGTVSSSAAVEGGRVLAHKLGCKCRKSGCMKKYCECYAGNVKCTSACRCMGCKNQGSRNAYDHDGSMPPMSMTGYHPHMPQPPPRPYSMAQAPQQSGSDHWGAAESLTFLKSGTPPSERKASRPFTLGVSPVTKASPQGGGDLPSLASSSEGTSPGEAARKKTESSTPVDANKRQDDALLLAAVAMTEFGQSPPPSSTKRSAPSSSEPSTPPTSNHKSDDAKALSKRSIDFEDSPLSEKKTVRTRSATKKVKRDDGDDS